VNKIRKENFDKIPRLRARMF